MSLAWATITRWVMCPLMSRPRMSWARALASSGLSASLTPPALPRPPTFTCALTTTGAEMSRAMASAWSGVSATPPGSTGTPCEANRSRAWYSKRSTNRHRISRVTRPPHRRGDGWEASQPRLTPPGASRWSDRRRPRGYLRSPAGSGVGGSAHVLAHPVDDLRRRRAGGEDPGHAQLLQLRDVLVGDDAAAEDDDVVDAALTQQLGQPREQGHVRAGEHGQADGVGVLLDDGLDDLLRGLVEAGVDHLHAGVAQRAGDDLRPPVVPVEAGHADDRPNPFVHHGSQPRHLPVARVIPARRE